MAAFWPRKPRGGVPGLAAAMPEYMNFCFFSAGFSICQRVRDECQLDAAGQCANEKARDIVTSTTRACLTSVAHEDLMPVKRVEDADLEGAHERLVHAHHGASVIKLAAVVGR